MTISRGAQIVATQHNTEFRDYRRPVATDTNSRPGTRAMSLLQISLPLAEVIILISLLIITNVMSVQMPDRSIDSDFLFTLFEVQRLLRLFADKQASRYGLNRAQWAVLAKLERTEGLKQADVAELMEMQPITLTRLIDKLCKAGLIERRGDETDRRINRLYLTRAARPLLTQLAALRGEITQAALADISVPDAHRLIEQLETVKDNVRNALQGVGHVDNNKAKEQRYG